MTKTEKALVECKINEVFDVVELLKSVFWMPDMAIKEDWSKNDYSDLVLKLELHTLGMSDNENYVNHLLKNNCFSWFHTMWKRGGHYYFEINPKVIGFRLVSEYCTENNVSRQSVYQSKEKFDWITVSKNKVLIREK